MTQLTEGARGIPNGGSVIGADRNRSQKHVARARIILAAAIGRPAVWRWQQRFAETGVDRLLRDKTRKPGKPRTAHCHGGSVSWR